MRKSPHSMLVGTWRFDKRRTMAEWVPRRAITRSQRDILFKSLQVLTVRFTRSRRYLDFRSVHDKDPYRVVWSRTEDELASPQIVIVFCAPFHGEIAQHIEFISSNCFRVASPYNYEYFKRLSPKPRRPAQTIGVK